MRRAIRIGRIGRWGAVGDAWRRTAALVLVALSIGVSVGFARCEAHRSERARCGRGFTAAGPRCAVPRGAPCPPPLVEKDRASEGASEAPNDRSNTPIRFCDAPDERVLVPAASFSLGPSDWEAEGRVSARVIQTAAFRVDAFEATRGAFEGATDRDAARAASGMTRAEAAAFCGRRGGRLPSEDEWIAAAASARNPPRRYPWGDTGAVCRRAAWGLATGPCALAAALAPGGESLGADTVGAHTDGDSPLHLHDLAGNVAEWVAPEPADPRTPDPADPRAANAANAANAFETGVAKGGSWQSALAADLRIWARLELDPAAHDPRVGVRCVYPE